MTNDNQNRREFIKAFSYLTGATLFVSSLPWISCARKSDLPENGTGEKVKIGMIGIGSRGSLLYTFLSENPGVELVAFCDNYPPHLERIKQRTNDKAKYFVDYQELLKLDELQAVVIATPLYEHARMTLDAFKAGKHVFCEKAMAMTTSDIRAMYDAHIDAGKILHIGHQRLFNIRYLNAIERIKNGEIGKVTQIRAYWHRNNDWRRPVPSPELERKINWRLYKEYSCGLMTELASHQIQVANWILEETPEHIMGSGSIIYWNDGREVEDNVNLVFQYPSGVSLVYDSLTSNKQYGLEEQIQGNKGTLELEQGKIFKEFPPPAAGIVQLINNIEHNIFDVVPIGGASWVPDNPNEDKGDYIIDMVMDSDGTRMEMEMFAQSVKEDRIIPGLAEEGYNASIATILGYEAIQQKKVLTWPEELKIPRKEYSNKFSIPDGIN